MKCLAYHPAQYMLETVISATTQSLLTLVYCFIGDTKRLLTSSSGRDINSSIKTIFCDSKRFSVDVDAKFADKKGYKWIVKTIS